MVTLKPRSSAVAEPKPQYGHLSKLSPDFEPLKAATDEDSERLWKLPLDEFKAEWKSKPPALVPSSPVVGKDITIEHMKIPVRDGAELEVRIYKPIDVAPNALLFFNSHGGGWVVGSYDTEEGQNRLVAASNKAVVVSVDYRMAPEFKFPYAINDCFDAMVWCKSNASLLGINPEKIVVGGGSSGGNLAAALAQKARDEGVTGIIGQVLNIPVTCHPNHFPSDEFEYGSYEQNDDGSIVDSPKMFWFWDQYLPGAGPDVYASPLLAKDFTNLPPALIQVAGADPLRDEALAYAQKLIRAAVRTTVRVYPGLPHGFYFFADLPVATEYLEEVSNFIRSLDA